tara:strand:- start:43 stop:465 length:423 start_codon:yes stop_codon:yes gene_type:complete
MFDTKSSFILSKLGIQGFIPRDKKPNKEEIFGALWGNILTLIDKPFNELDENELDLLTKIIKAISDNESDPSFSKQLENLNELSIKPQLSILFTDGKLELTKDVSPTIKSEPLHVLLDNLELKKRLWLKIKEFKNGSSVS